MQSCNFLLNCDFWNKECESSSFAEYDGPLPQVRLGPMTGAVENVGYSDEKLFYSDLVSACCKAGVKISLGDGTPDFKLLYGIEAAHSCKTKASVFIKPYPDERIFERFEWAQDVADFCGIDIDSYNIVTMRNLVHLEKKTPAQMLSIKKFLSSKGIPFVIKGVFTKEDLELVKEVKPDVVYVSNHGGRVETEKGSTGAFLRENRGFIKNNCSEIWIDGGIRNKKHLHLAARLGASSVLLGRPFASALCSGGEQGIIALAQSLI